MTDKRLSQDVKKFIADHITSLAQLEVLLLLHSRPEKEWTAQEISQELRLSPTSVAMYLADLERRGLLAVREVTELVYWYQPQKSDFEPTVDNLAQAYPEYRFTVINLIFSKPLDKIKAFSDSFKFREDKDNG
ncbi:MAG TPA: helix-turn-helix domain-containing protein [Anaerolineae bacterium]|nr:helix-turn-helix domain-containing protein [Anaerolineae bacterium]